jgi:hypothetical protein
MRSTRLLAVAVLAVIAMLPLSHAATGVVDQKQELDSAFSITISGAGRGQEFVPNLSPLIGIDVHIMTGNPGSGADTITLNVREYSIVPLGGLLLSTTTSQSLPDGFDGWVHFDLPSPVDVTPGSTYVVELTEAKSTFGWYTFEGNVYPNGRVLSNNNFFNDIDFTFRTYAPSLVGAPVGGVVMPVNKLAIAAPYVAIFGLIAAVTLVAVAPWKKPDTN